MDGEEVIGGKIEDVGKLHWRAGNPCESWRGVPEPSFEDGKINSLNIKGNSLVIL